MDLIIITGIIIFFGFAALSMIANRDNPQPAKVIVVKAEQLRELDAERGSAGFGIFLLIAVVAAAVWLL